MKISQTKRQIIFARDGWQCVYCGITGELHLEKLRKPYRLRIIPKDKDGEYFEVDHVIPKSKGGDNSFNNLVTACQKCNGKKSDKKVKPLYRFFRVDLG